MLLETTVEQRIKQWERLQRGVGLPGNSVGGYKWQLSFMRDFNTLFRAATRPVRKDIEQVVQWLRVGAAREHALERYVSGAGESAELYEKAANMLVNFSHEREATASAIDSTALLLEKSQVEGYTNIAVNLRNIANNLRG